MRCPACVEEGSKVSRLDWPSSWGMHSMGHESYYDEQGKYHDHDPNASWSTMSCSQGHKLFIRLEHQCGSCDYNKGKSLIGLYGSNGDAFVAEFRKNEVGEWERALVTTTG